jgi:hypothetical protein
MKYYLPDMGRSNNATREALRSPDFAQIQSCQAQKLKLRRAGCPRRPPRPRILGSGVLEYWSIGGLRFPRIAPSNREVGPTFPLRPASSLRRRGEVWRCNYV